MEKPVQKTDVDLTKLRDICQSYLDYLDSDDYHEDNDYKQYIFEEAMKAIFGNDVWKYINSKS